MIALICTFVFTWSAVGAMVLLGIPINSPLYALSCVGMMWIPGLCALLFRKQPLQIFNRPNRWWFYALGMGAALATLSVLLALPFFRASNLNVLPILILVAIVGAPTVNTLAALGEELMWRGYLWQRWRFKGANWAIGAVWGLWHAPLIALGHNYPGNPWTGIAMMTFMCMALSPLFSYFRARGGSVMVAALLHASINAWAKFPILLFPEASPFLFGLTGLTALLPALFLGLYLTRSKHVDGQSAYSLK